MVLAVEDISTGAEHWKPILVEQVSLTWRDNVYMRAFADAVFGTGMTYISNTIDEFLHPWSLPHYCFYQSLQVDSKQSSFSHP